MPKLTFNGVYILLIALFAILQYRLWFEQDGVKDMMSLKKTLSAQEKQMNNLKKHNDDLIFQIRRLQKSKEATESRARGELGMIKKGETYYQFVK